MYLSRICISNFRNFSKLDVALGGNVVVVGENRVGKSNLLYALRLIFDPALADRSGISVCSVAGTNFHPYAKLLTGLEIPFAIITDWDPTDDNTARLQSDS
jgi:predicted ATP-dependent endonuclease of OLD family